MGRRRANLASAAILCALVAPAGASAVPPDPGEYQENDFGGSEVFNIVGPGQNGLTTAADAAAFQFNGDRPPHQYDQQDMYANLVYNAPGLKHSKILDFFKDASFGVEPSNVEGETNPMCAVIVPPSPNSEFCDDVTVVRDQFGVPHVYGQHRAALMFGLGYVTGMDRLFLADVLRHGGRAEISSFVGGSEGNRAQDRDTFAAAPYMNEAEYQIQIDQADEIYGQEGVQIQEDVANYTDGINQWIAETRLDPVNKLDALYAAIGHPQGPEPWSQTDIVATGALVAGIFGKGGGGEIGSTVAYQGAREVLGVKRGTKVWKDFQSADDPEAPRTVRSGKFPYQLPGGKKGAALPDPGSLVSVPTVQSSSSPRAAAEAGPASDDYPDLSSVLGPLSELDSASNALLVSAAESKGGKPVAVFGPQTGYFAPQLLMEQDAHAPATDEYGPAIDARGVAFVGTNLYVQLGRGVDYSWSATSAGQDIVDTYAVKLCEPGGGKPTIDSMGYRWRGECLPIEVIEHTNSWTPNAADMTPPGSETLQAFRTNAGLISHRATVKGKPFAYTSLRATYKREVDAARSFADWNSPDVVTDAESWIKSAYKDDLTFNWFYADNKEIAYFNSGANPVRPGGVPAHFPVKAKRKFMWRDYNAELNTFRRQPISGHAQVKDQRYLTSWNNKSAKGIGCDSVQCYSAAYRSQPLDDRVKQGIKGQKKMSLVELINAMEDAGTVDLRGDVVLPFALDAIRRGKKLTGELRAAMDVLEAWAENGAHRRDMDNDGAYDHADAVRIMDAWWPLWVQGQFKPTLGDDLFGTFIGGGIHDAPGPVGSAFNNVTYGYVAKDLRSALGDDVKASFSRVYCGDGKLGACTKMLRETLLEAASTSFEELYGSSGCELQNGTSASPQMCKDAVNPTDVTIAAVDEFHWINRPTFQQAVQYQGHR
ncbi:MAG: penicillin acylase family protein [Actinomycetota bacterium]|nr:penicillin acylase family protein [Actinomycetota bacterium]